ncbi:MAG: amidohydrolase family protein [Gemmatimonadota bacterium]
MTGPVGEPATVFVDFNVVPMDRDVVLPHQTVLVRGRLIERIADAGSFEPPRGARIIQGDGTQYLAPGLTDAHVHLRGSYEDWFPLFVANGVTTVFNLEGRPSHLALKHRIAAGEREGPTVYTAGRYVEEPAIRTPADARSEVARQAARGYDFVKVHGNLAADTYAALTEAGRELDIPVIGHAPRNLPFSAVLENRQVAVTHAEELIHTQLTTFDVDEAREMATRMAEAGTWLMPTLAHFDAVAAEWGSPAAVEAALVTEAAAYLPGSLKEAWRDQNIFLTVDEHDRDRLLEMADFHRPLLRALHDAGVPMMAGTDTPIPTLAPGFSLHREIDALREIGLTGYEALATATVNPGRFIRSYVDGGAHFGTLRRGSRADIVMLDADPRTSSETLRRPRGVMVRGIFYARSDLDRILERVAAIR